jgi:hypothetical protein
LVNSAQTSVRGGGDYIDLLGSGDVANLYGTSGNWDWIDGSNSTVYVNSAQTSVRGGGDSVDLLGSGDVVNLYNTSGVSNMLTDNAQGTTVEIGSNVGSLQIANFGADSGGVIDLLNGVGGYSSAAAAVAALNSDGSGGSLLTLGSFGTIDFVGVAPSALHSGNFKIG